MSDLFLPKGPRAFALQAPFFVYRPREYSSWLRRHYGEAATLRAPHVTLVMSLTSNGARQVLSSDPDGFAAFQKKAFTNMSGRGSLFVLDGAAHHRERQLLMPSFQAPRLRQYGEMIQSIIREHMQSWSSGEEMRAHEVMLGISRDVILRVVLGPKQRNELIEAREVLRQTLKAIHPLLEFSPQYQSRWSPHWRDFQRAKSRFSEWIERSIAQRRASTEPQRHVLSALLEARHENGNPMSFEEMRDELYTILLPGHATTGAALAWALYELGRHPSLLDRLRDELDALGPEPDPALIASHRYLAAVCSETLRLHTIVTEVARLVRSPIDLHGYTIPAGTGLGISISAIHQDAELYPEPDRFLPQRFLDRTFGPFEFLPFGGGHRRCLGAALSDFEMRIILATVVSNWDYEVIQEEREMRHNLGMGPRHGVRLRLRPRKQHQKSVVSAQRHQ